ncbi:MAG: FtsW/RodA/SpoVE family cell cycle protein [Verrucomicrobiota bacterium]
MTPLFRKFLGINWILVLTMYGLLIFGIFSIHAAGWTRDEAHLQLLWNRQVIMIAIGTVFFFTAALIDYRWLVWISVPFYLFGIGLLIALRIPGFGVEKSGAVSWLQIGTFTFQPSQIAIASGIILFAVILGKLHNVHKIFRNHFLRLALAGLVMAPPFFLVLTESDIGSAAVWLPVLASMLLIGSIPFRYLISLILVGTMIIPVVYFFVLKDYQKARIDTYIKIVSGKEYDERGDGWVPKHLQIAIGSGGWKGKGYKTERSVSNTWLPKDVVINDFIFAPVAEEHGFRGAMLLISGLAFLILQALFVAFYARDQFGRLLIIGIVALIFTHCFMNIGMNINLVPITGLPLPFVSYGGTFTVIVMFLLGVVQSVWVHRDIRVKEEPAPNEPASFNPGGLSVLQRS